MLSLLKHQFQKAEDFIFILGDPIFDFRLPVKYSMMKIIRQLYIWRWIGKKRFLLTEMQLAHNLSKILPMMRILVLDNA